MSVSRDEAMKTISAAGWVPFYPGQPIGQQYYAESADSDVWRAWLSAYNEIKRREKIAELEKIQPRLL